MVLSNTLYTHSVCLCEDEPQRKGFLAEVGMGIYIRTSEEGGYSEEIPPPTEKISNSKT